MKDISEIIDKYLGNDQLNEWSEPEEKELLKQGYELNRSGKAIWGKFAGEESVRMYQHPTTKKYQVVFRKSVTDKIKKSIMDAMKKYFGKAEISET